MMIPIFYDGLSGKVSKNFQIDVLAVSFAPSESAIMICRAATRTNITLDRVEGAADGCRVDGGEGTTEEGRGGITEVERD